MGAQQVAEPEVVRESDDVQGDGTPGRNAPASAAASYGRHATAPANGAAADAAAQSDDAPADTNWTDGRTAWWISKSSDAVSWTNGTTC